LKTVGRDVATHISQFLVSRRLADNKQFAAFHQFSAFVMHDLKNLVAQLSLVVRNAERHKANPEFIDDSIKTIANSVARMDRLIKQLGGSSDRTRNVPVSVVGVLRNVAARCAIHSPRPQLVGQLDDMHTVASPDQLESVFEHLVRNGQAATRADGTVTMSFERDGDAGWVTVADNGQGMDDAFVRERLFQPFYTTKGASGMGIGAYQAREYVRSLGGDVEVESALGKGTRVRVRLLAATSTPEV
jgi:putative PEP-CTERM system histidine kinase